MRAAVLAALLLLSAARGQEPWARLDALLPPALRDSLPAVVRLAGDLCELPAREDASVAGLQVVEHGAGEERRYPLRAAAARLRDLRPAGLALYAPGWGNSPGDEAARHVVRALRAAHPLVLELDAGAELAGGYAAAAARLPGLARALAGLLRAAARAGLAGRVHGAGFSLGAHALGAASRRARGAGAGLARLTALDPARPCLARGAMARRWRLRRGDAEFVHVVHSSAGALGLARPLGHVDVYVRPGPGGGAAGLAAAHQAAPRAWADGAAQGARCRDARAALAGACAGDAVPVGHSCASDTRGIFILNLDEVV